MVSACYSGSFIDELQGDHTLVISAAAHDRTSFGCSNEAAFTYFGGAFFDRALRTETAFIAAFETARELVAARERAEGITPSLPQIAVGAAIRDKLLELESRLSASLH